MTHDTTAAVGSTEVQKQMRWSSVGRHELLDGQKRVLTVNFSPSLLAVEGELCYQPLVGCGYLHWPRCSLSLR